MSEYDRDNCCQQTCLKNPSCLGMGPNSQDSVWVVGFGFLEQVSKRMMDQICGMSTSSIFKWFKNGKKTVTP